MRLDLQWPKSLSENREPTAEKLTLVRFPPDSIPCLLLVLLLVSSPAFSGTALSAVDSQPETSQQIYQQAQRWLKKRQYKRAAELLAEAASQGNRMAQYRLGLLFARGVGVGKNLVKARKWLHKAALQGHPKAQFYLGQMYLFGDGGAKELVAAATWFWLATSLGDRYAKDSLRVMIAKLSAQQFEQAKIRARELWPRIPHDMKVRKVTLMH